MDKIEENKIRIAVASSDGIVVNEHFGRAQKFYIYDSDESELKLVEIRNVTPVCELGNHDDDRLKENAKTLSDCQYLLVSKIGQGALRVLESLGVESFEIPGIIQESIEQLIKYIKIQALFA